MHGIALAQRLSSAGRARAARDDVKKAPISRAQRSAATLGSAGWPPSFACSAYAHHPSTEPRGTTGVRRNHTNMQSRRHDGRLVGITRRTERRRHDGRSVEPPTAHDHAPHDGPSARRADEPRLHHALPARRADEPRLHHERLHHGRSYHASTTRTGTTGTGTTGVQESPLIDIK